MGKTIGQLRKEGKSFKQIARIGRKESPKAAAKLDSSVKKKRSSRRSKTIGELRAEGKSFKEISEIGKVESPTAAKILEKTKKPSSKRTLTTQQMQFLSKQPIITKREPLVMTKQKIVSGELRAAPGTLEGRITRKLTPKLQANEFEKVSKGVGTAIKENVFGAVALVNLVKSGEIKNLKVADVAVGVVDYGRGTLQDLASGNSFRQARALTDVATWFIPVAIPGKVAKILRAGDEVANSVSKFTTKKNIVSGSTKINIDTNGLTQANKPFKQKGVLRYDPKTKSIVGNVKTTVGKKSFTSNLKLKEEVGFYVDRNIGIKIPKKKIESKTSKVKIKEIKYDAKAPDVIQYKGDVKRSGQLRDIKVKDIDVVEVGKKRATRVKSRASTVKQVVENDTKIIKAAAQQLSRTKNVDLKKFRKTTGLSNKEIQRFLEFYNFDKRIIRGVDARTKLGRALGLRKDSKLIDKLLPVFEEGRVKLIQTKGFVKAEGVLEEINPILARLGISKPKLKGGKLLSKDIDNIVKAARKMDIPDLTVLLRTAKKLKVRGLLGVGQLGKITKAIDNRKAQLKDTKRAQEPKKIPQTKQKTIKVPAQRRVPAQKKKQATAPKARAKAKTTIKPKIKTRVPKPRIRLKEKVVLPIPKLKLSFDSKQLDNRIATYKGVYRERKNVNKPASKSNPVVTKTKTIKSTRNRVLKTLGDFADKRTIRSIQIEVIGIGKTKKDIKVPVVVKKFDPKKSKGTPVLRLVEKPKFALDNKGEKREVKRAKAVKGSTKKKTTKTVKVSKKKDKSSQNRSKVTKKSKK